MTYRGSRLSSSSATSRYERSNKLLFDVVVVPVVFVAPVVSLPVAVEPVVVLSLTTGGLLVAKLVVLLVPVFLHWARISAKFWLP